MSCLLRTVRPKRWRRRIIKRRLTSIKSVTQKTFQKQSHSKTTKHGSKRNKCPACKLIESEIERGRLGWPQRFNLAVYHGWQMSSICRGIAETLAICGQLFILQTTILSSLCIIGAGGGLGLRCFALRRGHGRGAQCGQTLWSMMMMVMMLWQVQMKLYGRTLNQITNSVTHRIERDCCCCLAAWSGLPDLSCACWRDSSASGWRSVVASEEALQRNHSRFDHSSWSHPFPRHCCCHWPPSDLYGLSGGGDSDMH